MRDWSHWLVLTPFLGISGFNNVKSDGPTCNPRHYPIQFHGSNRTEKVWGMSLSIIIHRNWISLITLTNQRKEYVGLYNVSLGFHPFLGYVYLVVHQWQYFRKVHLSKHFSFHGSTPKVQQKHISWGPSNPFGSWAGKGLRMWQHGFSCWFVHMMWIRRTRSPALQQPPSIGHSSASFSFYTVFIYPIIDSTCSQH